MATPKKLPSGKWKIEIMVSGQRESGTFDTKSEALTWASKRITELKSFSTGNGGSIKTLQDAMRQYAKEVSPNKKGERWERIRIRAFEDHDLPIHRKIIDVTPAHIAKWRDSRMETVSGSTVAREMTLLNAVFEIARKEWGWIYKNPFDDIRKPSQPPHRERTISGQETRSILRSLGYRGKVEGVSTSAALAFLFALQTGMRAGEICSLKWNDIHDDFARLKTSKTGKGRNVPLTKTAKKTLEKMKGFDPESVFSITPNTLDAMFRRARDRAHLSGFTFHDSRHTAATRLAQKLHVLDLCKVFGWASTTRALTYYNPKSSDLAARMS